MLASTVTSPYLRALRLPWIFLACGLHFAALAAKTILILLIRFYQRYISIFFGPACRFHPTCSQYALDALKKKKLHVAVGLIVWRLARCQPLCKGGWDPLPADRPREGEPPASGVDDELR